MAVSLTWKERRARVIEFLHLRRPMLSDIAIDNAMMLADAGYLGHTTNGEWARKIGDVILVIKPEIVETMQRKDFRDFIRKQEFLARSGRIPKGKPDEGAVLNAN